jgi:hypothetical protein
LRQTATIASCCFVDELQHPSSCNGLLFCWSALRWALLYTLPDAAKGDVKRSPLNTAMAAAYDFFYK